MRRLSQILDFVGSNGRIAKALGNISAVFGIIGVAYAASLAVDQFITPTFIELSLAFLTFVTAFVSIYYFYSRLRKRTTSKRRIGGVTLLPSGVRLRNAIRLSIIDADYFLALIWMKATRAFLMFFALLILVTLHLTNTHTHQTVLWMGPIAIVTHNILDAAVVCAIAGLSASIALLAYETHMIAVGVAKMRIDRYWRMRKQRWAR